MGSRCGRRREKARGRVERKLFGRELRLEPAPLPDAVSSMINLVVGDGGSIVANEAASAAILASIAALLLLLPCSAAANSSSKAEFMFDESMGSCGKR